MNSFVRSILLSCFAATLLSVPVFMVARSNDGKSPNNTSAQEVQSTPEQTKQRKKIVLPPYGFSEITPLGTWTAVAEFDVSQSSDVDVPVIIVGLGSYAGKGAWAKQLMVDNVTLRNQSTNQIKAVKLGWIVLTAKDREARKNRNAALREGFTQDIAVSARPGQMEKINNLHIDFVKETKDLITSGKINGMVFIRLRVSEVEFANGSRWKEGQALAKKAPFPSPSSDRL